MKIKIRSHDARMLHDETTGARQAIGSPLSGTMTAPTR